MALDNIYPDIPSTNFIDDTLTGNHAADKQLVFAGNGVVYGFECRGGAAIVHVNLYDAATAAEVTPGTTARKYAFAVQVNETVSKGIGLKFNKGCVIAFTTAVAGGTASAAAAVTGVNIQFHAAGG